MFRRILVLLLRVAVSVGLIVYVFYRYVDFQDRTVLGFRDRVVSGERVAETASEVTLRVDGATRSFPTASIVHRETQPGLRTLMRGIRPGPFAFFFLLNGVPIAFCGLRWWLLLRDQGLPIALPEALRLFYVGVFMNNFFPGGVGGDLARGVMAFRRMESRRSRMVGTILLDRIVGLVSLACMSAVGVASALDRTAYWGPAALVWGFLLTAAAGYLVYFSPRLRRSRPGRWVKGRLPAAGILGEIDAVFQSYRHRPRLIGATLGLSVAAQGVAIVALWGIAGSMGIGGATLADYFTLFPLVAIVTAVPVSFGGWGFGEWNFQYFFGLAGMAPGLAVTLSIVFRLAGLFVCLPAAFLMSGRRRGKL